MFGKERGFRPRTPEWYDTDVRGGARSIGSRESAAVRIADSIRTLGLSRFDLKHDLPHWPRDLRTRTIELYEPEDMHRVRKLLARRQGDDPNMPEKTMLLGTVGAGKAGTAIAAGYDVAISGSRPADRIALTVGVLAPAPEGSRVVVQMYLPSTRVVMRFNQLNCHGFEEDRRAATPRAE